MVITPNKRPTMPLKCRAAVFIAACLVAACRAEPRAAICFYGLTRSLSYTIDTIWSKIFDPLIENGISYSVFLHTYNVTEINNAMNGENHVAVDWRAFRRLQPAAFEVEDADAVFDQEFREQFGGLLEWGDPWDAPHHSSLKSLLLQLHSLKKVAGLQEEAARAHGPFDVIIALRSDLWIFNRISIEHVRAAMQSNATVYTPASDISGGLNARLAFGHPDAMHHIMHRLDDALGYSKLHPNDYPSQQGMLLSEPFLKYVVDTKGLIAIATDIILERVRANGFLNQVPEFDRRGDLARWKPGRWLRKTRRSVWEPSAIPKGFTHLDTIVRLVANQRDKWSS